MAYELALIGFGLFFGIPVGMVLGFVAYDRCKPLAPATNELRKD